MTQAETFAESLVTLGFEDAGTSRWGGRQWVLEFNRFLTFSVHDFDDEVVFTWAFLLGDFFLERGMQIGAGETTFQELYPRHDVRLRPDPDAVRNEITRTLRTLRIDLGDPGL
ncbi:MAG: hypothetical protein M3N57_13695 [Actinomycetota bacterium]|nr:hypothetical protein [Actinomycetota bacterium]